MFLLLIVIIFLIRAVLVFKDGSSFLFFRSKIMVSVGSLKIMYLLSFVITRLLIWFSHSIINSLAFVLIL
jgi:hypothetical protein